LLKYTNVRVSLAAQMPPKKKDVYNDAKAASHTHGHLITASKKWAYQVHVSCHGKSGQMLGGGSFLSCAWM